MSATSIDFHTVHLRDALADPGHILGSFAVLFTAYWIARIVYNVYFHPLSKYPGPKLYAATPLPICWLWWNGNEHETFRTLHDKYGEVVRVSPNDLSYTGAQAWKDIYGYRPGVRQLPKDMAFYTRTGQTHVSDMIVSNDADHSRFRRSLSNAFSDKALRSSEPILTHYFDLLISRLKERAASPKTSTVDLTAWYNWTTFDIIGDLALGEPFNALENAAYHPYILTFFKGFKVTRMFRILRRFNLEKVVYEITNFISNWHNGARYALSSMQRGFSKECIARRLSPERKMDERQDFLFHVLRQNEGKGMTREELERNCSLLVLAGSETTATFLSGTTYRLLKNPDTLKELTDEVRGRFKSADEITLASTVASDMPYLHGVIEEGLRVYPPVPARLPRRTTEPIMIKGDIVPADTSVGVHQYASCLSSLNYHNPTTFAPSRWLPTPPPEYANDILDSNQPFSTGPRNCLGKNLAYGEMRCVLARMVWQFDMELDQRSEGWNKQKVYTLWTKGPLLVKIRDRTVV